MGKSIRKESDQYGTTSRHDKKDRQEKAEASKEEKREKTEEVKLQIARFFHLFCATQQRAQKEQG